MYLSVIIPAFNEEKRIGITLERLYGFLRNKNYDYEVILVDDGSTDSTVNIADQSKLAQKNKLRLLSNGANRGKGFSIRNGMMNARGQYVLFSDADLSTPIEEMDKLFSFLVKDYDIAIGSRGIQGADVREHQPFYREWMGKIFNFFVQIFVFKGIFDTQCGFKLFKAHVAKKIAPCLKINGFSFDVELLYVAKRRGYKIKEVPVVWINSPKSKVRPVFDSLMMFKELLSVRKKHGR